MSAVDHLTGLSLDGGWKVTRHLARNPNGTGGTFSQSYEVERGGLKGFLKAFDFTEAFEHSDPAFVLQLLTSAYNHERDILQHCSSRRLSHIVLAVGHGNVCVPGMPKIEGQVFYLIFEMADGDVRCQMTTDSRFGVLQCVTALKDISLGLLQVHREMIAHQDAKPSNVLVYKAAGFKIADFGRASRKTHPAHHDQLGIAGDRTYAPPELLYGYVANDFTVRRMGCDLYMLGNLAAFLFSGVNMTALLLTNLDRQHHPSEWTGTYDQVLPYLQNAFTRVLEILRPQIDSQVRDYMMSMIAQLCNPELSRRGHSKGLGRHDQYSLERYVSELDRLLKSLRVRSPRAGSQ